MDDSAHDLDAVAYSFDAIESEEAQEEEAPALETWRVVLALSDATDLDAWIDLALRLTPSPGHLCLRGMVQIDADESLSEGALDARAWRDAFAPYADAIEAIHDDVRAYVDYQPMARVLDELLREPANLLIVQWAGPAKLTGGVTTDGVLQTAPCDAALITRPHKPGSGAALLAVRGGTNLSLGVTVARAFAADAPVTLFHAADADKIAPDLESLIQVDTEIVRTVTAVGDTAEGIIREARGHGAVVLGARFQEPEARSSSAPPVITSIFDRLPLPLALVRAFEPESVDFHPPVLLRVGARSREDLSMRVDRWFAENTFHSSEFEDVAALIALKQKQGVTISVGLPALNEEKTIGALIDVLKGALMDAAPLIDEIVLIDSSSTDRTVAIAREKGIPVYRHAEILPEVGSLVGKGEALWKSLHVLKGDIVVWVDTDISNMHPRFIYGLIGPLLRNPRIQYVKGFYQRPIQVGGKLQVYGGGRVTELVARPLLNLFYPELSGVVQPLSGEYAGRRTALQSVPFFSGYGVETGLLIDLWERYGLDAIAQTDLEVRVHHNQPLVGLSKMAFAILQIFIARLEAHYGVQLLDRANRSMKLIIQEPERLGLEIAEIGDQERPPIVSLAAYRDEHDM
ncbi:MAG: glucosyl-3-phosphoglycerate synthase [Anaerolineae bacterium]|nr:glucosyl-3-phosphoglycerate synthase [Anaerolineae bacterium]